MTDHTLLPCPFCGGEGAITPHVHALALKAVVCDQCSSSSGWYLHEEEAIAAWNRRTPPAAVPEPWGWLCNGKGDGWEERDKVVRDPELIARYRERPDLWRIEPLYLGSPPAAVPDGWAIVPCEPDDEMTDKGESALIAGPLEKEFKDAPSATWAAAKACYRAMISAAPAAPTDE